MMWIFIVLSAAALMVLFGVAVGKIIRWGTKNWPNFEPTAGDPRE